MAFFWSGTWARAAGIWSLMGIMKDQNIDL